jgi:UDP-N-acetylmuramate--alanine ligase
MFDYKKDIRIHFVGIGGIGMSGIAEVLCQLGYAVSGSDIKAGGTTERLKKMGVEIFIGHKNKNVQDCTVVVYSSAVESTNPELIEARNKGIPLIQRAEMLAELMRLKQGIAIAGTHGKTTTTSFLATILAEAKLDATHIIGGIVENLGGHARVGKGEFLVAEADESDGTFLLLSPIMSVITNIDSDHIDHYKSDDELHKAFIQFANKIPFYGRCALNVSNEKVSDMIPFIRRPYVTFGLRQEEGKLAEGVATGGLWANEDINFAAGKIASDETGCEFDLYYQGEKVQRMAIKIPGVHNVLNALGAISIAKSMGIDFATIGNGIKKFMGVGRRLQTLYKDDQVEVIDDYAHHPTAVMETLKTLKTIKDSRIIAIFEPHRYTRTRDCWQSFLHCFNDADKVYILPIYAASEKEIGGINSSRMVDDINSIHPQHAQHLKSLTPLKKYFEGTDQADSLKTTLIFLGAGSLGKKLRVFLSQAKGGQEF